jgi:hypothetical protein
MPSAATYATMLPLLAAAAAAASAGGHATVGAATISVVSDIPGRARSQHYAVSALAEGGEGGWQQAFVLESTAKAIPDAGYFSHLNGFTNSWASVMLGPANTAGVRLRVSRLGGAAITTASASPAKTIPTPQSTFSSFS